MIARKMRRLLIRLTYRSLLRRRLRKACKRLGIKPYKWQEAYALGESNYLAQGRRTGKTTAVMLFGLIRKTCKKEEIERLSQKDQGIRTAVQRDWWVWEYEKMRRKVEGLDK